MLCVFGLWSSLLIHIYRESKGEAVCGDRAAICVGQFDAAKIERGILSDTIGNELKPINSVIINLNKIKLFKEKI